MSSIASYLGFLNKNNVKSYLPWSGVEMLAFCLQKNPESQRSIGVTMPTIGQ